MSPRLDPVASDEVLPEQTEVIVIGGGIIGVCTAFSLAERGVPVVLCEKGRIGGEQSSRNWGWCRKMGRDPAEIPLSIESLRLWEGMNALLGAETGYRRAGIAYLCETETDVEKYEAWVEGARLYQLDCRMIAGSEIQRLLPHSAQAWKAALYTPSDGRAEPRMAAPAIAEGARRRGARIITGCAVRSVEMTGGRVAGVVTERGRVRSSAVVLAGGAWSRLFCGNLGVRFPQLKVLASVMRTAPLSGAPEIAVGATDFGVRKDVYGGYIIGHRSANIAPIVPDSFRLLRDFLPALCRQRAELRLRLGRRFLEELHTPRRWAPDEPSPFERVRILDPVPSQTILEEAQTNVARAFPAFRDLTVVERWGGLIDVTPDAVPVIGPVPGKPGFFLASGFSGHGFGIGPGAGRLMADLVTDATPLVDPAPFRFERLARAAWRHSR